MSVRHSLLAILTQGPCYGYQLRSEFDRRTGSTSPLNVGQVYNTLERLERDGLVRREAVDEQGQVFWSITAGGRDEVARWVHSPTPRTAGVRDDLAIKIAVLATIPGLDVQAALTAQTADAEARASALAEGVSDPVAHIVLSAAAAQAQAELTWIAATVRTLEGATTLHLELSRERPKRGRPVRAPEAVSVSE